jgi:hypothetical protein
MVHSLRPAALTGVVEALTCIIFPFIWRYGYIPMCPLNLCQDMIESPTPIIIGMDSRFFNLISTLSNVICVDLDTNSISWTKERTNINIEMLPKRPLRVLRERLQQLNMEVNKLYKRSYNKSNINNSRNDADILKKRERQISLAIREAFLRFMAAILNDYKLFLKTVIRRPDTKVLDRNLAKFFDFEGFLNKKEAACQEFYKKLIETQLFYDCIMNLSFTSELEPSLAYAFTFFAECCSKVNAMSYKGEDIRLLNIESRNDQTVFVLPPTAISEMTISNSAFIYNSETTTATTTTTSHEPIQHSSTHLFPRLKNKKELKNLVKSVKRITTKQQSYDNNSNNNINNSNINSNQNVPTGVRTKGEKLESKKKLESLLIISNDNYNFNNSNNKTKSTKTTKFKNNKQDNNLPAAKNAKICAYFLLSNAYTLWFMYLPDYLKDCSDCRKYGLNYAYHVLIQMEKHGLSEDQVWSSDEICYRIMMQLCYIYKIPTLAVKTYLLMQKYKIELKPFTYAYYNKAIIDLDSWPSREKDYWTRLRLLWRVASAFKHNLIIKKERDEQILVKMKNKKKRQRKTMLKKGHQKIETKDDFERIKKRLFDNENGVNVYVNDVNNKTSDFIYQQNENKKKNFFDKDTDEESDNYNDSDDDDSYDSDEEDDNEYDDDDIDNNNNNNDDDSISVNENNKYINSDDVINTNSDRISLKSQNDINNLKNDNGTFETPTKSSYFSNRMNQFFKRTVENSSELTRNMKQLIIEKSEIMKEVIIPDYQQDLQSKIKNSFSVQNFNRYMDNLVKSNTPASNQK